VCERERERERECKIIVVSLPFVPKGKPEEKNTRLARNAVDIVIQPSVTDLE
jgi:hypothetical protein